MATNNKTKKKKKIWKKISDMRIRHIWIIDKELYADDEEDDLPFDDSPVNVSPDWYQCNGTPIDENGNDMLYSHTEILVDSN